MKKNLKKIISRVTRLLPLEFLMNASEQGLILPFYHSVSDENLPHIKNLYAITSVNRFEEDLSFFAKHYKPVNYKYLVESLHNKSLRKEKAFFLSFDDGLREFHDIVAPILLKLGIPATFFVNSNFVDNKNMFYRLKISILIERIHSKSLSISEQKFISELFNQNGMQYKTANDLMLIKNTKKQMADQIATVLDVSFSDYLSQNQPYLTTKQIESLIQQGFTLGAHSVTHPYYPDLSEDLQLKESIDCIHFLHDNFKTEARLFSFPYTDFDIKKSFFDKIANEVDLTFGTANMKLDSIRTNFQRIPMEITGSYNANEIIKNEYVLFILKKLISRHIIIR